LKVFLGRNSTSIRARYIPNQHKGKEFGDSNCDAPWKVSIADLLFLLGLDHSFEARKELAIELGCPTEKMGDSALMNTWLHTTVLEKIAENGSNIPMELLD
jgi:hypothetical protein